MAKAKQNIYYGTGRRKASIAKVRLTSGTGKITVNGKDVHEYLPYETLIMNLSQPLELTNTKEIFDIDVEEIFDKLGLREHITPNRRSGMLSMVDKMKYYASQKLKEWDEYSRVSSKKNF